MKIVAKEHPKIVEASPLDRFLDIPPYSPEAFDIAKKNLLTQTYPRDKLADLLRVYNQEIGNDDEALQKIEALRAPDSFCVITGQQLGLMGGPSYTIWKAITCLLMAREFNAIPIFWLATEDHDVGEIDHTYFLDEKGNFKRFRLRYPKERQFVEDLVLTEEHQRLIDELLTFAAIPLPNPRDASYTKTMIAFLLHLFRGTGLVFLEPKILRPLAIPFFQKEICHAEEIQELLQRTTAELQEAGGEPQLSFHGEGTNLFCKDSKGQRLKIIKEDNGFKIGSKDYSQDELVHLIASSSERFSTNVAARPLLQSLLFPTLAYVGGPSELAYHRQLKDYFNWHGIKMPWIYPRLSATLLTPEAVRYLTKSHLDPWKEIPTYWEGALPEIASGIGAMVKQWEQTAKKYYSEEMTEKEFKHFIWQEEHHLEKRSWKMYLEKEGSHYYALHFLRNFLHPHDQLQERVLNWYTFQAKTAENLVQEFLKSADWRQAGHLYAFL